MKIGVVITAGGTGSRFSAHDNKLFVLLKNRPVLYHACMAFSEIAEVIDVVITHHPKDSRLLEELLTLFPETFKPRLIHGGNTRKESVQAGVEALTSVDVVMIHDGARPFVSQRLLGDLIKAATHYSAIIPGISISETLKEVEHNTVLKTVSRDRYRRIQTPQVFSSDRLKQAYAQSFSQEITDEAMMMEALDIPVHVVEGDLQNLKITTQFDYHVACALCDTYL